MSVGQLKAKIIATAEGSLSGVARKDLILYHIELPDDENLVHNMRDSLSKKPTPLRITTELSAIFPSGPPKNKIHIIIQVLQVSARRVLGKRSSSDVGSRDAKRINDLEEIPSIAPSSIQNKHISGILEEKVFYNRPTPTRKAIPIALLHSVFSKFLDDCQNHKPTEEDNCWVREIRYAMLKEYQTESSRCDAFRGIFKRNTGRTLNTGPTPGKNE
ncbi:hypothetical protein CPB86DRAFT_695030 [Serendipita vermifera]|nr:hypothetical protein CPB86DRAFT_695030 [Serendipita vermifera]